MSERDFCYWLRGFMELNNSESLSDIQWKIVKDHLNLVFSKKTPFYDLPNIPKRDFEFSKYEVTC